jgi:hypothetical protein
MLLISTSENRFNVDHHRLCLRILTRLASNGPFSIIIDDGSHVPSHQWKTFTYLWKSLAPGGLYIIEDVETSYWKNSSHIYGYSLRKEYNIVSQFKRMIDTHVNSDPHSSYLCTARDMCNHRPKRCLWPSSCSRMYVCSSS